MLNLLLTFLVHLGFHQPRVRVGPQTFILVAVGVVAAVVVARVVP